MTALTVAICLFCLIASAYFSASETAFLSCNKIRFKAMEDEDSRAALVLKLEEKTDKVISTILVGNNLVNILMTSLATVLFLGILPGDGAAVSTVVVTIVVLIFGEISPKTLAKQHADGWMLKTVRLLNIIVLLLTPVTAVFSAWQHLLLRIFRVQDEPSVSENEIKTLVEEAQEDGGISEETGDLLKSAIDFNTQTVSSILTPRIAIVAAEENAPRPEILQQFRLSGFSRIPVYRDTIDNIVGTLNEKDVLFAPQKPISKLLCPPYFVPESMKISELLREFQQRKTHLAIVVDEFGGTAGIVTIEDIVEELVGEIWDEHDRVTVPVRQAAKDRFILSGDLPYEDFCEQFACETECDAATVAGWVLRKMDRIPSESESFSDGPFTVRILKMDGLRVATVEIRIAQEENSQKS